LFLFIRAGVVLDSLTDRDRPVLWANLFGWHNLPMESGMERSG
jgi:hypothetical protein